MFCRHFGTLKSLAPQTNILLQDWHLCNGYAESRRRDSGPRKCTKNVQKIEPTAQVRKMRNSRKIDRFYGLQARHLGQWSQIVREPEKY